MTEPRSTDETLAAHAAAIARSYQGLHHKPDCPCFECQADRYRERWLAEQDRRHVEIQAHADTREALYTRTQELAEARRKLAEALGELEHVKRDQAKP